jgi:transposase InsO family protein
VLVELSKVEQRYEAVLAVQRDGMKVTEVAEAFAVSRQTVHSWLARYEAGGLGALADRSHRPRSCPHGMAAAVEARLCELRMQHPGWGPTRLVHQLGREQAEPLPSRSGVYRALVRHGLIEPKTRRKRLADYRRWERGRPMELWQMDVVGGVVLADGTECKVLTGLDDHSRYCVAGGVMVRAVARSVCAVLADALRRHGVPEEILTDNGKVFTNRFGLKPTEVLFDRICRENGIAHRLTAPRSPTTTGKIERFHRTLRVEFLAGRVFDDLSAAQCELDAWVADYNDNRPHQGIGMCTPAQRFHAARHEPSSSLPVDLRSLGDARTGDDWISRRVAANGVISVAWQAFSVGKHRGGEVVDVHVTDTLLEVWSGNELVRTVLRTSKGGIRKKRAQAR